MGEQMTPDEAKALYAGKYFYEIVKPTSEYGDVTLVGPLDNIFYATPVDVEDEAASHFIKFVKVVNGCPVQAFTEKQILVTDRVL